MVVEKYQNSKSTSFLQRDCIHFALTSKAKPRYMPNDKHSFSYRVWYVVDSRPFEFCIMIFIALNTVQLMMQVSKRLILILCFAALNLISAELECSVSNFKRTSKQFNFMQKIL